MFMSKTTSSQPMAMPTVFAMTAAVARGVYRGFADAWTVMQNRRQLQGIAELDDHLLADIGLTRDDVRDAYALPAHRDPSLYLADLSTASRTRGLVLHVTTEEAPALRCAETARPLLRLVANDRRRSE